MPKAPARDQFSSSVEEYRVRNLSLEEVVKVRLKEVSGGIIQVTLNFFLEKSNIPLATWFRRMKNPVKITVEEIELITQGLNEIEKLARHPVVFTPALVLEAIRNQVRKDSKLRSQSEANE